MLTMRGREALLFLLLCSQSLLQRALSKPSSGGTECIQELNEVKKSEQLGHTTLQNRINLMKAGVCFHLKSLTSEAMQIYQHVEKTFPQYAFVLVPKSLISLKSGDPMSVILLLDEYFDRVGGIYGEDMFGKDTDTNEKGTPCRIDAPHRLECVSALNYYGVAQMHSYNDTSALFHFELAMNIGQGVPYVDDVYNNYAYILSTMGHYEKAEKMFIQNFWYINKNKTEIDPSPLVRRALLTPKILPSIEKAIEFQALFEKRLIDLIRLAEYGGATWSHDSSDLFKVDAGISTLEDIRKIPPLTESLNNFVQNIQSPPHFYLHYYGFHDRHLNDLVHQMFKSISHPSLSTVSTSISSHTHPALQSEHRGDSQKIRIAFVSCLFGGNEPHGLLLIDIIRRLPKELFESIAIGLGNKPPSESFLDAVSGNYFSVGYNEEYAKNLLSSQEFDCIVFAENLNDGTMHFLAYNRFAPVQILVMGAPVTSSIPTIDYFISGDRLEHPFRTQMSGDKENLEPYSEQVVLLDGQAISFPHNEQHNPRQDRRFAAGDATTVVSASINTGEIHFDEYGIPSGDNISVYMCFQNLFKIHPKFDIILMRILIADMNGHVVLQAARDHQHTNSVKGRIIDLVKSELCPKPQKDACQEAQNILSRIHFIPRVMSFDMKKVFQRSTVAIHPFPFGGSKTASDILGSGVPLVIYPQEYLRGRMAASFYTTMAIHEIDPDVYAYSCCIASDVSDYISKALRLGQDTTYREKVSKAIMARNQRIFSDDQISFEWARFLTRAVGVVVDDKDLALEMEYEPQEWQEDQHLEQGITDQQRLWRRSQLMKSVLN